MGTMTCAFPAAGAVDARDYDAFWLWAGVVPQPVLARAQRLYVLTGQVEPVPGGARLIAQGGAAPLQDRAEVWMAYRAHTLDWPERIYAQIRARLRRWRALGAPVVGVQIDFDAGTRHLDRYGEFLRDLRRRLPPDCKLSITGLLDWAAQGEPAAFDALADIVDEVVIQTYQGRRTVAGYEAYLASLRRLRVPFRIGLVQDGEWREPEGLATNPQFRGYVVFLVNPRPPS